MIYEITDPKAKTMGNDGGSALGARIWDYVTFGKSTQWKYAEFLKAFDLGGREQTKGEFDTAKLAEKVTDTVSGKKVTKETGHPGAKCKLRLRPDSNQDGNYRAKVASILGWGGNADEDVESAPVEEVGDEGMVEDEATEEGYTEADLKALSVAELKEVVNAFNEAGHELVIKGKKKSDVIAMILAAQAEAVDEDVADDDDMIEDDEDVIDDDDESPAGYSEDDLKAMATPDLKEVAKTLSVAFGGKKKSEVIAAIMAAQAASGGDAAADDDDDLPF